MGGEGRGGTDLLEVFLVCYRGNDIVKSIFITRGCISDEFYSVFKRFPLDTRGKQLVLTKNVIAWLTQESKFSSYV